MDNQQGLLILLLQYFDGKLIDSGATWRVDHPRVSGGKVENKIPKERACHKHAEE